MAPKRFKKRVLFLYGLKSSLLGLLFISVLAISILLPLAQPAQAATNSTINFQARLQTNGGGIVPDGYYNVQFKLYDALTSGTNLWTETYLDVDGSSGTSGDDYRVRVKNGYLTVNLGSRTAFPSTINWDQELWITMNVGGTTVTASPTWNGEMSPRLKLTAVPYAFKAGQLAKYNSGSGFTSSLSLTDPTVGNQNFVLPDMAAAGTWTLLNTATGVQLQQSSPGSGQTGHFNISGTGIAGSLLAQSFDVASAGVLSIGTGTAATAVTIGNSALTGTITLGQSTASNTINIGNANTANGNTQTINIGAGTPAGTGKATVTIGNTANASGVIINAGSTGIALNGDTTIAGGKSLVLGAGIGTLTQTYNSTGAGSASTINLTNGSGTNTNGFLINRNAASGTTTNGLNITNTAGTLANGIQLTGTMTNLINSGSFVVSGAGAVSGITGLSMASGSFAQTGAGTFATGTGAVSLNGDVTIATGKRLTVNGQAFFKGAILHYDFNDVISSSAGWFKLGTLTIPQGGENARIVMSSGAGYNADPDQMSTATVDFRTSNSSSLNANGFAGSGTVSRTGFGGAFSNVKFVGNAAGGSATAYEVFVYTDAWVGAGWYSVEAGQNASWADSMTAGADPGADSSTVYAPVAYTSFEEALYVPQFGTIELYRNTDIFGSLYASGNFWTDGVIDADTIDLSVTLETGGTTRLDASGNLSNIGTIGASGLITATGGATISGAAVNLNANSNNATNINTGTSTGAVSIGGGSNTFALNTTNIDISSGGAITGATGLSLASGNIVQSGSGNFSTGSGTVTLNGSSITLGDASTDRLTLTAQILGGSPLVFQGSTDNAFSTTLGVTEPTANNTITLPNASGTVAVSATGNIALSAAGQISLTGQVGVTNGGTGLSTMTSNGVLYGNGTGNVGVTAAGTTGQCLVATTSAAPAWGTCGTGNATTMQDAYDGSGGTANPHIQLATGNSGLKVRDNATPVTGNLLQIQNSGGTATYFGVGTAGMTIQNSSAVTLLNFNTSTSTLRIAKTGSAYIDLYHDGSNAYIAQATGTLNVGGGSGNINMDVNAVGETINAAKTATLAGAYSANTFNITEALTGGANTLSGTVLNVSSTSTTSNTNTTSILRLNRQNGTGGNLILAQTGGSTTRFSVSDTGNLTATGGMSVNGGTINLNTTSANAVNIANGAFANAIAIGNVTGATSISMNSGSGGIGIGNNGSSAGTITIGNGSANVVNINAMGGGWQISTTGDATLEDIAMDGNFIQSGATTFATGTGAISLNGDTTIANGKKLTLGSNATDPSGTDGAMYYNSTNGKFRCYQGSWFDCVGLTAENSRKRPFYATDFLDSGNVAAGFWQSNAISSGTLSIGTNTANNPGVVTPTSSTTNPSGWRFGSSNTQLLSGSENFEIIFNPATTTSINTRMGFVDNNDCTAIDDGAWIDVNGSTLTGKAATSTTTSTTGTSYTVSTSTWYRARVVVNSAATTVNFYLYNMSGTQLWTNSLSTNIPTSTATGSGMSACSTNTSSRALVSFDYMAQWWDKDLVR